MARRVLRHALKLFYLLFGILKLVTQERDVIPANNGAAMLNDPLVELIEKNSHASAMNSREARTLSSFLVDIQQP
ncbi:MAG: hypothetical protein EXS18_04205 [Verrucomicrobiae bacterium]|nr:hypothetical protein [Verrucomicrobiae bacterium]